jgi:hypothetical protein
MTIESIEQQLSATRDTLAKLESQLAALKKPAEVKYRPAELPRDYGRSDAEFRDKGVSNWTPGTIVSFDPLDDSRIWFRRLVNGGRYCMWNYECRVPVLPGDEYREPVLPGDVHKECDFSVDGVSWVSGTLTAYSSFGLSDESRWCDGKRYRYYKYARIRTGATA